MKDNNLVSCVCVARNRVPQLRRAVACFLAQTYRPRELVIVYESDDRATRDYFLGLKEPSIRAIEVAANPKKPLGSLRNISIESQPRTLFRPMGRRRLVCPEPPGPTDWRIAQ